MRCRILTFLFLLMLLYASPATAQINVDKGISLTGTLQSDMLFPQEDLSIGTGSYKEKLLTNTYLQLGLLSKYVMVGARLEYLDYPLPGFEPDLAGWGVSYLAVTGMYKGFQVTVGDFYDQFGSGFILRLYEDRNLGIDNSLRGARVSYRSDKGVRAKILGGKQRRYWNHNDSYVWGGNVEVDLNEWWSVIKDNDTQLTLEGAYVGKKEDDEIIEAPLPGKRLHLPKVVNALDVRLQYQKSGFNIIAEYAAKSADPSSDNYYVYKNGSAAMLSTSYSQKGLSVLLQAKRSDNMNFRSQRTFNGVTTSSFINNLPVFAFQHTYALARVYPYSTQSAGEWAIQGELAVNRKRNTRGGGKYGTSLKLGFAHIRSIYDTPEGSAVNQLKGTNGDKAAFFNFGDDVFYQDIHVAIEKKFSRTFQLNAMYMNQRYNPRSNNENEDVIRSNIFIVEGKLKCARKITLRAELQYLLSSGYKPFGPELEPLERANQGDWMYGLVELSIAPMFMFTVSDMYNVGDTGNHYYNVMGTFNYKQARFQLGYGKTRKGYSCAGGICRSVPASKGFLASVNYSF